MEYCTPEFLRGMMNASSLAGRPFFFAVDYEMTRGIFIPGDSIAESPVKFRFPSFGNAGKRAFPRIRRRSLPRRPFFGEWRASFSI